MLIKKGIVVRVQHSMMGDFYAIATRSFETESSDLFYPLALYREQQAKGFGSGRVRWGRAGDEINFSKSMTKIAIVDPDDDEQ